MTTTGMYLYFSHFNFSNEEWLAAADRFIELEQAIVEAEELISGDHDRTHEDFVRCEYCDKAQELRDFQESFAERFALQWATVAIQNTRGGQ